MGRACRFPPTVFAQAYSFLAHLPLPNVPGQNAEGHYPTTCFPFRGSPQGDAVSHASGTRPSLAHSATTTLLVGCAAARWSHPAHAAAGRPPVRPSPLSFYSPAAPSLYHCSRSDPPSPDALVPHSNCPCHHSVAPFPQPSLVVEQGHATREWCSRIFAQLAAPFPATPGTIIASFPHL